MFRLDPSVRGRLAADRGDFAEPIGRLLRSRRFWRSCCDVTERKKAEESLRKLSQAVEQSPVNVIITDLDGNIEYVNRRFCQLTGYTAAEVLGKNPRILKSGHTSDEEYRSLWQTIKAGGEWSGEFLNKAKDGSLFWERACYHLHQG